MLHTLVGALGALWCLTGAAATPESAVSYPTRPVRFVIPFAPGGGTDIVGRAVGQKLSERWGQPVIIDNRAGGNGNTGAAIVAKSAPDGYNLLLTTNAPIVMNPHLGKLSYDPLKDFTPITIVATVPFVLLVNPAVPAKSIPELMALAKTRPGKINYGSSGNGGGAHLSGEVLKQIGKMDVEHVPYKGSGPALYALLGGEVQFMFVSVLTATPLIAQKRVRALSVTSLERVPTLPETPAMSEFPGFKGFEVETWYGLLAPHGTDPRIIQAVYNETKRVIGLDEVRNLLERGTGAQLIGNSPADFAKSIRIDYKRWGEIIRAAGVTAD